MNNIKKYLLFILAGLFLIGAGWFIFSENYPVAFIGLKTISAKDFNKNYYSSLTYYKKALETYSQDSKTLEADESKKEIKRAVLDNLIENILIDRELRKELKPNDLNALIEKKMSEISESQTADKAVETLYGFSFADFKELVLTPQAKREIFEGRLFLAGIDFGEKMKNVRSLARVMIFLPGFNWDGKEVVSGE